MQILLLLATAADGQTQRPAGGGLISLLPFVLIAGVFYFLIIRPQRARQRAQQDMIRQVGLGDRIVTIGGFHGTVEDVSDDVIRLEIAPGTIVTIAKQAVARTLSDPVVDDEDVDALGEGDDDVLDQDPLDLDGRDDERGGRGGTA